MTAWAIKLAVKVICFIGLCVVVFVLGFSCGHNFKKCVSANGVIERTDTLYIRDTITVEIPKPITRYVTRIDTLYMSDTIVVQIPIERVVYSDSMRYNLTIEGYNPQLVDMQLYTNDRVITRDITHVFKPRWAISVGTGVGYTSKGIEPYVGVVFGYVIWGK